MLNSPFWPSQGSKWLPNDPQICSQVAPKWSPDSPKMALHAPKKAFLAQWLQNCCQIAPTWPPHASQTPILGQFDSRMPKIAALTAPKEAKIFKKQGAFLSFSLSPCSCCSLGSSSLSSLPSLFGASGNTGAEKRLARVRCIDQLL